MSQLPGPPGRPPQGEGRADPGVFGAPFEPQPGVYGQPPAAFHGQPDSAYGYGHPGPGGPAYPGGGRKKRGRTSVVAAVLAAVLVVGAGVWYATGDGGDAARRPVAEGSASAASGQPDTPPGRTYTPAPKPADLNAARKDGESRVLWVQENTVDLPGRGARSSGPGSPGTSWPRPCTARCRATRPPMERRSGASTSGPGSARRPPCPARTGRSSSRWRAARRTRRSATGS